MASVAACSWMVLAVAAHGHDWHRWRAHAPEWSWQWLFPSGGMMGGRGGAGGNQNAGGNNDPVQIVTVIAGQTIDVTL